MLGAVKLLLPLGVGIAGLVALSGKSAQAQPATGGGGNKPGTRPVPTPNTGKLSTAEVVKLMTSAIASADPAVLRALADRLEKAGFPQQAADLRGVANELAKAGAAAAGAPPPATPNKPATPPAAIPPAPSPTQVSVPPPVTTSPTTTLPEIVVTGTAQPSAAERELASRMVIDQQSKPKWKDNRDLVSVFQTQESRAGSYKNIQTGAKGTIDGLYGPATAISLAERYGIVPPNPKYWPKNPAPALTAYRNRLLALAAADPARASEWQQAASKAKVT
jgi:hypothetical protein